MSKRLVLSVLSNVAELTEGLQVSPKTVESANNFIKEVLENEFGAESQPEKKSQPKKTKKVETAKKEQSKPTKEEVPEKKVEEKDVEEEQPETVEEVKEEKPKPEMSLQELIEELPEGDGLLVEPPYSYFALVPPKVAERYLSGVKISEVTSADAIAKASKKGVNKDFIDLLLAGHSASTVKVDKPIKTGEGSKAGAIVAKLAPKIEKGEELFEVMSRGGADSTTVKHFAKIVELASK